MISCSCYVLECRFPQRHCVKMYVNWMGNKVFERTNWPFKTDFYVCGNLLSCSWAPNFPEIIWVKCCSFNAENPCIFQCPNDYCFVNFLKKFLWRFNSFLAFFIVLDMIERHFHCMKLLKFVWTLPILFSC